jgi:hypothetical protein
MVQTALIILDISSEMAEKNDDRQIQDKGQKIMHAPG